MTPQQRAELDQLEAECAALVALARDIPDLGRATALLEVLLTTVSSAANRSDGSP